MHGFRVLRLGFYHAGAGKRYGLAALSGCGEDFGKVREFSNDGQISASVGTAYFLLLQPHRQKWDSAFANSSWIAPLASEPSFNLRLNVYALGGVFLA